jgi:lisH domain-containing protein FOPNL
MCMLNYSLFVVPDIMTTNDVAALKAAMRETLESNGQLDNIKAQLRAVVFQALDASSPESRVRPPMPPENMILNEIIREYLSFNGYDHTMSVFTSEIGLRDASALPRSVLGAQVGLRQAPKDVPLLYAMLHDVRSGNAQS